MQTTITFSPTTTLLVTSDEYLELKCSKKASANLLDLGNLSNISLATLKENIISKLMKLYDIKDANYDIDLKKYIYQLPNLIKAINIDNLYDPVLHTNKEYGFICISTKVMYKDEFHSKELTLTLNLEDQNDIFFEFHSDDYFANNKLFMLVKDETNFGDNHHILTRDTIKELIFKSSEHYKEFIKSLLITAVYHL